MTHLSIINPATDVLIDEIPVDDADTVHEKVQRATIAQSTWANTPLWERIDLLRRVQTLLAERQHTLAATLTSETGKPITQARNEISATIPRIQFFIDHVADILKPTLAHQDPAIGVPGISPLEELITYEPLGVVANISAWNYPYFVGSNVFVPAILTGNAVLYKPSEFSTLTGIAIANVFHDAGVPESIFIPIIGGGITGATLLEHPLGGIFFTGSYTTGMKIAAAAGQHLTKAQLELGGKDPAYVCDDVPDVRVVAEALADGAFYNNGQSCCAVERIYVHAAVYDEFVAAFLSAVDGFIMGDPMNANTYLGPISRKPQLSELERQVKDALAHGATLRCGGQALEGAGWYFSPTVFTEVTHEMAIMKDETFGPVIGIQKVDQDEEAVRLMNDTSYGLTASVYCSDRTRAVNILRQVNSGTSYWNCCDRVSPYLPWTGRGHSGLGSTLSLEGIRAFVQPRAWHLKTL